MSLADDYPVIRADTCAQSVSRAIKYGLSESGAYKGWFERMGKPGDADKHIAAANADAKIMRQLTR